MAEASWPSPNHNSRNVTDQEYEDLAAFFSGDGVWGNPGSGAVVEAGVGLTVVVKASKAASVRGHQWASGNTDFTLTVDANSSGSPRVDWVVLRLDRSTWDVNAVVKAGTPGAGPPVLERSVSSPGVWEIPVAQVTIPDGATSVTVQRHELYIGTRIRPCTSTTRPILPSRGEIDFELDTGRWIGWNGSTWELLHGDSGELPIGQGFSVWEQHNDCVGEKVGRWAELRVMVRRRDSTFRTGDVDGSKIGTIPDVLLPARRWQYFTGQFTNGATARVEVRTTGEIWVTSPSSDIPPGVALDLTMNYLA